MQPSTPDPQLHRAILEHRLAQQLVSKVAVLVVKEHNVPVHLLRCEHAQQGLLRNLVLLLQGLGFLIRHRHGFLHTGILCWDAAPARGRAAARHGVLAGVELLQLGQHAFDEGQGQWLRCVHER